MLSIDTIMQGEAGRLRQRPISSEPVMVHGDVSRFAPLLAIPELKDPSALLDAWSAHNADDDPRMSTKAWSPGRAIRMLPTKGQVRALYDSGFCVLLSSIEKMIPALQKICFALERELHLPVGTIAAEAFCALEAAGTKPHFDDGVVLNLQIAGEKTWWLAKNPAIQFPNWGMSLGDALTEEARAMLDPEHPAIPATMPEKTTRLEYARPGSVVYLPPGALHATRVESASFAICFTMIPPTLADQVAAEMRARLLRIERLRAPILHEHDPLDEARHLAVASLRTLADDLEQRGLGDQEQQPGDVPLRLREGLSVQRGTLPGETILATATKSRALMVGPTLTTMLAWVAARQADQASASFHVRDAVEDLIKAVPPRDVRAGMRALVGRGILEESTTSR